MLPSDIRSLTEAYQSIYSQANEQELITDDLIEEVVEELIQECVEFGYDLDEAAYAVEEAAAEYFDEAKVTYGSDTESPEQRRERAKAKVDEKRAAARKAAVKGAVERVKAKASGAKAAAGIAASIAKDEARRAGRKAVHGVKHGVEKKKQEVKSGVKSLIGKGLRKAAGAVGKVASKAAGAAAKLGEETIQEADSIAAMRERAAKRRKQRYGASDTSRGGRDDFRPYTKADYERGEANDPRKKQQKEEFEIDEARAMGSARSGDQNPKGSQVRVSSGRGMTMTPARGLGASKPKGDDAKRKAKYDAQAKADRRAAAKDRAAEGEDRLGRLIRKVQREELEATGLFSEKEIMAILEAEERVDENVMGGPVMKPVSGLGGGKPTYLPGAKKPAPTGAKLPPV